MEAASFVMFIQCSYSSEPNSYSLGTSLRRDPGHSSSVFLRHQLTSYHVSANFLPWPTSPCGKVGHEGKFIIRLISRKFNVDSCHNRPPSCSWWDWLSLAFVEELRLNFTFLHHEQQISTPSRQERSSQEGIEWDAQLCLCPSVTVPELQRKVFSYMVFSEDQWGMWAARLSRSGRQGKPGLPALTRVEGAGRGKKLVNFSWILLWLVPKPNPTLGTFC